MKILVTGGLGYVGGRLARSLLAAGHDLRLSSRDPSHCPDWARRAELLVHDPENFAGLCDGIDAVIHCAAMNEIACAADPEAALRINAGHTMRLAKAARSQGIARFIHLSTAHVYGPLAGRVDEATLPAPRHPYAIAHRAAEDFVLAEGGVAVRLSNAVGAPAHAGVDRWTVLANDLCRQAVTTGRLVLKSSGLQHRDFIALVDVEQGIALLLQGRPEGIYNLGRGTSLSVLALAQLVAARAAAILGIEPPLERPEPRPGETGDSLDYSVDRLAALGFRPSPDLNAEIDATLDLCREAFRP